MNAVLAVQMRLVLLMVLSVAPAACVSMAGGRGEACSQPGECSSGDVCYRGYCVEDDAKRPDTSATDAVDVPIAVDAVQVPDAVDAVDAPSAVASVPASAPDASTPPLSALTVHDAGGTAAPTDAGVPPVAVFDAGVCGCSGKGKCDKHTCDMADDAKGDAAKSGAGG